MFKPLILSNIAICWGAFPWFSMVLKKLLLLPQDKDRPPRCFFSSAQQTRIISQVLSPAQAPHILSGAGPPPLISRSPRQMGRGLLPILRPQTVTGEPATTRASRLDNCGFLSHNLLFVTVTVFYQNPQTWLIQFWWCVCLFKAGQKVC